MVMAMMITMDDDVGCCVCDGFDPVKQVCFRREVRLSGP